MSSVAEFTLLDVFLNQARSLNSVQYDAVECAGEQWTYGDLDVVSSGLAIEFATRFGIRPIVAIISENHPYILATILAIWKLGGVVAPIDHHTPKSLMERMLASIAPDCVVLPSNNDITRQIVEDISIPLSTFDARASTFTTLIQRFLEISPELSANSYPVPGAEDLAIYLHTSSSSSMSNIKCVPLTHQSLLAGSRARLAWWRKTWPELKFESLRVLGWSPWSHVIGVSHDLGAATFLTGGCYVFGILPSAYYAETNASSTDFEVSALLLEAAVTTRTNAFACVPWVLEGMMHQLKNASGALQERMREALCQFKIIGSGGASTTQECISWAKSLGIRFILDLGMTELAGALFHSTCSDEPGFRLDDCMLTDAEVILVDDNGHQQISGELQIKSKLISRGYLQDINSAFKVGKDGSVVFRTGDIYQLNSGNRLLWKGRKEDYLQMSSGECLDPRVIEEILNQYPAIARSCVLGNNFLRGPAQSVCAIIELNFGLQESESVGHMVSQVTKSIAFVNRSLSPPLRIAWSRVLILDKGQQLPLTKKRTLFRKNLEELFGEQLSSQLNPRKQETVAEGSAKLGSSCGRTRENVKTLVEIAVSESLNISMEVLQINSESTFAELGMDSSMATKIVNKLNQVFDLCLPPNTCHTHLDVSSLTISIWNDLGLENHRSVPRTPQIIHKFQEEEIVIVGQALRLPGNINCLQSFWEALVNKRNDVLTHVPSDRWDHKSFYRPPGCSDPPQPCDITFEKAGFINLTDFDNTFFGISSAEAVHVAPAVRLTLETAFEALENANIPISKIRGTSAAVYVATGVDEGYNKLLLMEKGYEAYSRFYGTGVAISTVCGRLSYLLDIHGPSITVDTACSAGLVAFDQAFQYLISGEGDTAIVCGVNTHTWPGTFGFLSAQHMTSVNSRCATFTTDADGYGASEAAVAVILKTRSAALRDRDTILSFVRATDVKHDGKSQGLVAPNVKAQIAMQRALLAKSSLVASQIDLIEAHGTGTQLGDLIEIQAINEVFKGSHTVDRPLFISASKTCVGHAELAAGLVGVIAAVASLQNVIAPGLVHLTETNLNPSIDCSLIPMHIPVNSTIMETPSNKGGSLRALVLANGFAGTIAGAVIESFDGINAAESLKISSNPTLFVISAKTLDALAQYIADYIAFLRTAPSHNFQSICYTSCVGREHYRYRFACVTTGIHDLVSQLEDVLSSGLPGKTKLSSNRLLFAFPGQGSQFQGMARDLYYGYSNFASILSEASAMATSSTGVPILSFLVDEAVLDCNNTIDKSEIAQVCIFVYQYSIWKWLESLDIIPQAVMGHSLGEIAAAVAAGTMTFTLALEFVVARAKLLRADPRHPAGMAAIALNEDVITHYIKTLGLKDRAVIAVYNGLRSHVVAGDLEAVTSLVFTVKADGARATKLNVDQGFHSPCIANAIPDLRSWLEQHESMLDLPQKKFFSAALGREVPQQHLNTSQYWVNHAKNPVKFSQAATEIAKGDTVDVVVDIGPQPTIWTALQTPEFSRKVTIATTGKRTNDQEYYLIKALASLFEIGLQPNFREFFFQRPMNHTKVQLPNYPFQRQHHFPTYIPSRHLSVTLSTRKSTYRAEGESIRKKTFIVDQPLCDMLSEHRIEGHRVLPGAASIDFFARSCSARRVESIRYHQPLVLDTPDTQVFAEIDSEYNYILYQSQTERNKICSGVLARSAAAHVPARKCISSSSTPQLLTHIQVYQCFHDVQFGQQFQNIREVRIWPDHADAMIQVEKSRYPEHDRIRKLDACLHFFGAIAAKQIPQISQMEGAFFPSSLEGFALHSDDLPYNFICRYHLPIEVGRNHRVLSVAFELLSNEGGLLLSCEKYSVAFIPSGVVVQSSPSTSKLWLLNHWNLQNLPNAQSQATDAHKFDELLYVGIGSNTGLLHALSAIALKAISLELTDTSQEGSYDVTINHHGCSPTTLKSRIGDLGNVIKGTDLSIVIDITSILPSDRLLSFSNLILSFMKLLMSRKVRISSFVLITSAAAPVYVHSADSSLEDEIDDISSVGLGSIVQGMLRVFRRETALENVWTLDLPVFGDFQLDFRLQEVVIKEIQGRFFGAFRDGIVAYRYRQATSELKPLVRLVPVMTYMEKTTIPVRLLETAIIVGLGSIGSSLAPALISAGCDSVVFFGRRAPDDHQVSEELTRLRLITNNRCHYMQADACDLNALRSAIRVVQSKFKTIEHVIHTALIVNDAAITNVTKEAFNAVLRPKIIGAWNLHVISEEAKLPLKSFVLLSSIQVLIGNPGQVGYVSGNTFLDTLATHRHSRGLPATSLQLGAWESKLIKNVDLSKAFDLLVLNEEGIPLILQAMTTASPVQIIAKWNAQKLSMTAAYANDPFFAEVLPSGVIPDATKAKVQKCNVDQIVTKMIRSVLELRPTEPLDLEESLTSCGIDSISFAQIRGQILNDLEVEVPMLFLSDAYSINDLIAHVTKGVQ